MQDWILWIVFPITLFGSILNTKKKSSCFLVWGLCNTFWLIHDISSKSYARSIFDMVNLVTNTWGMLSWIKPKRKSEPVSK